MWAIISCSNICASGRNQKQVERGENQEERSTKNMCTKEKAFVIPLTQTTFSSAKRIDKQRSVSKSQFLLINLLFFSSH